MIRKVVDITKIKVNPDNPRIIKDKKFKSLVQSIKDFPEMLEAREVVVNTDMMILGGNMRYQAAKEAGAAKVPIKIVDWPEDKQREFIIKDNVAGGEWDYDVLANEWDATLLSEWGVDIPTRKNTDLLSTLEYSSIYYEPLEKPTMTLADCVDTTLYDKKMEALGEYNLTKEQVEILRLFAYRFIKIDFESVANYYAFNATEEEKKAIERLRLVLTDDGVDGFIEDDLLKILDITGEDVEW